MVLPQLAMKKTLSSSGLAHTMATTKMSERYLTLLNVLLILFPRTFLDNLNLSIWVNENP